MGKKNPDFVRLIRQKNLTRLILKKIRIGEYLTKKYRFLDVFLMQNNKIQIGFFGILKNLYFAEKI